MHRMHAVFVCCLPGCSGLPGGVWYALGPTDAESVTALAGVQRCIDGQSIEEPVELEPSATSIACDALSTLEVDVTETFATLDQPDPAWFPVTWRETAADIDWVEFDVEPLPRSSGIGSTIGRTWQMTSWEQEGDNDTRWKLDCVVRDQQMRCETLETASVSGEDGPAPVLFLHEEHPLLAPL